MPRILACAVLFVSTLAYAAPAPPPLLPKTFAGWKQAAPPTTTPESADAPVLKEYGLQQYATTSFDAGKNHVTVRAWQFKDATGAFGAFTYYRQPQMHAEKIGRDGAAAGNHFVFWTGATVVDAAFARPAENPQAALTALAGLLPQASGSENVPPSLPHYLPPTQLNPGSVRYAIGPAAYTRMGGVLPVNAIDFSQDAEVVTAQYGPANAQATLTLLMYPTPQIAGAHLKTISALAGGMTARRSGPMVAVVSGKYPPEKAQQLIGQIHFNDFVTINHPEGYVSEAAKLSRLLLGIAALTGILLGAALLLGIFLGGGRALVRILRGKPVSAMSEEEFISLHLSGD